MGSASLYFALQPSSAVLGDINADLVTTFLAIRDNPQKVSAALGRLRVSPSTYRRLCPPLSPPACPARQAARFIFLNRFCFNGLYRTNKAGVFNVPYSPQRSGQLPTAEDLLSASALLRSSDIRCMDFEGTLDDARQGDFAYLDPPYVLTERRVFHHYGPKTFTLRDISRLGALLVDLDRRGVHFVVSYAYCSEALAAFKRWAIRKVFVQRNVAGFARHRRKAAELLASNFAS
jgi:DNA adenine methylase